MNNFLQINIFWKLVWFFKWTGDFQIWPIGWHRDQCASQPADKCLIEMHDWYTAMYGFVRIILSVNNAEKYATAINILLGDRLHTAESDVHGRQILTSKVVPALKGLSEPASHQFYSWLSKNLNFPDTLKVH